MILRVERLLLRQLYQILIWTVVVMFCVGLPRLLVVCTGPNCHGRLELLHSQGSWLHHLHENAAGVCQHHQSSGDGVLRDDGNPTQSSDGGCTDVAYMIDEGPLPERLTLESGDVPLFAGLWPFPCMAPRLRNSTVIPFATGPPRPDPRTELLASTLLLI